MIQRNFQIEFRKFLRIVLVFLQRKSWLLNSRRSASKIARCVAGLISFKLRVAKIDYCFSFAFHLEVTQSESVLIVHLKSTACTYQKVLFSPPGASMHMGLRPEDSIDFCRLPIGQASHVSSLCPHFPFYGSPPSFRGRPLFCWPSGLRWKTTLGGAYDGIRKV